MNDRNETYLLMWSRDGMTTIDITIEHRPTSKLKVSSETNVELHIVVSIYFSMNGNELAKHTYEMTVCKPKIRCAKLIR